jgi:hypothetical protein
MLGGTFLQRFTVFVTDSVFEPMMIWTGDTFGI